MKSQSLSLVLVLICTAGFSQGTDSADYFFQRGLQEKMERRYMVAYNDMKKAMSIKSNDADYLTQVALCEVELRKYDLALINFQKVDSMRNGDTLAIQNLANLNFFSHKWENAVKYGKKCMEMNLGTRMNYLIGKSYYELENYGEAYKYFQLVMKEEPQNAEIPYLLARAFVDMSNYRAAAQFYEKAISLDSSKARWIYEMAMVVSAIPNDKVAISYYELAAAKGYKVDNDYIENLSIACIGAGQPERAITLMQQLLDKKPADLNLLYNLAETYYHINKYQEAIDTWDKILYFDNKNARSLYMIGMSYQKKGDKDKGVALCDKAIEMDPSLRYLKTEKQGMGL
jgi:tetratricopeptide (TPR) repeat protein